MSDTPARFSVDGEPLNLAAAALDAWEWLRVWGKVRQNELPEKERAALDRCTNRLQGFLQPHLPLVTEERGAPNDPHR